MIILEKLQEGTSEVMHSSEGTAVIRTDTTYA